MKYNIEFITYNDLYNHVKETVLKYRTSIDFKEFTKNILDPIKMTFDSKVYGKTIEDAIESEIIRQMDKSNSNHIGYFHQNIFKYIGGRQWEVPIKGFDIVNEKEKIYVEMKNKHNTMNSSSGRATYIRMLTKVADDENATCMLVEIIAKKSQNIKWQVTVEEEIHSRENIRRLSIDKFYEYVTGDKYAFKKICEVLPLILDEIVSELNISIEDNDIFKTFQNISPNLIKSLYLLSFKTYEGFEYINIGEG